MRSSREQDKRGNNRDRARRRAWLLSAVSGWGGNGREVPCYMCGIALTEVSLTVDRIIMGMHGGTYCHDNIRPACMPCNTSTGAAAAGYYRSAVTA